MVGRVLTVAESDSSGSMGIQADIKTILAMGGYSTTAVTGVTAQTTKGIETLQTVDAALVAKQMRAVLADIGADAIKVGILFNEAIVNAVADVLDEYQQKNIPVVIDPSIITRNGTHLMDEHAISTLKRRLFLRATVLMPNIREAELMTGMHIRDMDDMRHAAGMMRTLGVETVILKAGQAVSEKVVYFVAAGDEERIYERPMLETLHTLGAGATLSSAIAISLVQGMDIFHALERALGFIHEAMAQATGMGQISGPMNHAFDIEKHSAFFTPYPYTVKVHQA